MGPERDGSAIAPHLPSASSVEVSAVCRTRPFEDCVVADSNDLADWRPRQGRRMTLQQGRSTTGSKHTTREHTATALEAQGPTSACRCSMVAAQ